jgi:flagellar biosynthetic protein FliQ
MIAVSVVLLISGNWILSSMVDFTEHLFAQLPRLLDRT